MTMKFFMSKCRLYFMAYRCKIIHLSHPLQIYELMQNFLLINQIRNMKLNVKI